MDARLGEEGRPLDKGTTDEGTRTGGGGPLGDGVIKEETLSKYGRLLDNRGAEEVLLNMSEIIAEDTETTGGMFLDGTVSFKILSFDV